MTTKAKARSMVVTSTVDLSGDTYKFIDDELSEQVVDSILSREIKPNDHVALSLYYQSLIIDTRRKVTQLEGINEDTKRGVNSLKDLINKINPLVESYNKNPIDFFNQQNLKSKFTEEWNNIYIGAMKHIQREMTSQSEPELIPIAELYADYHAAHFYITNALQKFKDAESPINNTLGEYAVVFDLNKNALSERLERLNNYVPMYYNTFDLKSDDDKKKLIDFMSGDGLIDFVLTYYKCDNCVLTFNPIEPQNINITNYDINPPPHINDILKIYEVSTNILRRKPIVIIYNINSTLVKDSDVMTEKMNDKYTDFEAEFNRLYAKYQDTLIKYVNDRMTINDKGYKTLFDLICIINSLIKLVLELNAAELRLDFNDADTEKYAYTLFNDELKENYKKIFLHYNFNEGTGTPEDPYGVYYNENKTLELFDYPNAVDIGDKVETIIENYGQNMPDEQIDKYKGKQYFKMPILIARRFAVEQLKNKQFKVDQYFKTGIETKDVEDVIRTIQLTPEAQAQAVPKAAKTPGAKPATGNIAQAGTLATGNVAQAGTPAGTPAQAQATPQPASPSAQAGNVAAAAPKSQAATPPAGKTAASGPKTGGYRQSTSRHSKRKLKKLLNKQSKRLNK